MRDSRRHDEVDQTGEGGGRMRPPTEPPARDDAPLWDLWLSRLHLPALIAADELGVFAFLAADPAPTDDVAKAFKLSRRGAAALLGVLAGLGFLRKLSGRFHITETAREYLLPDGPYYWGGVFDAYRSAPDRHTPEKLLQALREDAEARRQSVSSEWEAGVVPPGMAQLITGYMHAHSFPSAVGFARRAPLDGARKLLDVGAGSGCFSVALALRCPEMRFTLLDLPPVCEVAALMVEQYGLSDRITTFPANFFKDEWPTGHDAVLFSNILHDWPDERGEFLLGRAFGAMEPGGQVLIHEMLLADDGLDLTASTFSLQMVVGTAGSQLTAEQLTRLLHDAGFVDVRFIHTFAHFWTAVAGKP